MNLHSALRRLGASRATLWTIKHVISPLDRLVVRSSGGRLPPLTSIAVPTLLLTTTGRRSGEPRTVPLVYVRDGTRYVVANARPLGERSNPWVLNLRAADRASIRVSRRSIDVEVQEAGNAEADRLWAQIVGVWPALQDFYDATGERSVFVLEPIA